MPKNIFYAFVTSTGKAGYECTESILENAGVSTASGTAFETVGEERLRFSCATEPEIIDRFIQTHKATFRSLKQALLKNAY